MIYTVKVNNSNFWPIVNNTSKL